MTSIIDGPRIGADRDDGSIEAVEARVQRERARLLRHDRVTRVLYPILAVVVLLLGWELGRDLVGLPRFLLPSPSEILDAMVRNRAMLLREAWVTGLEVVLGFALSVVVGIPLAVAIFQSPLFSKSIYPILVSFQAVPKVAVAPLFIVWFGFGMLPKVLIAFLIAFFPVVINTVMGLASIEREKIHLARSIGLSGFETFRLIRFPNALPVDLRRAEDLDHAGGGGRSGGRVRRRQRGPRLHADACERVDGYGAAVRGHLCALLPRLRAVLAGGVGRAAVPAACGPRQPARRDG
jgi:ABC-type nitrate/sulfonate/bicarbonate transport system permease component